MNKYLVYGYKDRAETRDIETYCICDTEIEAEEIALSLWEEYFFACFNYALNHVDKPDIARIYANNFKWSCRVNLNVLKVPYVTTV